MNHTEIILSQYLAALEMLKQALIKCPETLWDSPEDKNRFWHLAYHALFYTHLYLSDTLAAFTPWGRHRAEYEMLGPTPRAPQGPQIGEPYERADLLEYLAFVRQQAAERLPHTDLAGASGFDWLPFSKLELQFYNIRHLQQHTGELMERLGARARVDVNWVGSVHP
jgi:hypothetical protein